MNLIVPRDTWLDMDRVLDNFFSPPKRLAADENVFFAPQIDIVDKKDHYEIKADLPGVKKEDLKISVENGILTIEASHKEEKSEEKDGVVIRKERRSGQFLRSLTLGGNVQEKDIKANFKDGVLVIEAPKVKQDLPKARQISVG